MRPWPATRVYYFREAFGAFNSGLIFTSVWTFYYTVMHLSLIQISLLYIIISITSFIMEIPTGIIADSYSRRWSIIIGSGLIGICFILEGVIPVYSIVLLAGFIEAIGDTCISGALEAWITDEIGPNNIGQTFLRSHQLSAPMHWVGVGLSIVIAALFNYQVAIILGGVGWVIITIVLILYMPETHSIQRKSETERLKAHFQTTIQTAKKGFTTVRNHPGLLRLFMAGLLAAAFMDCFYRFSRLHFLNGFTLPIIELPLIGPLKENVWFGLIEILQTGGILIGMTLLRKFADLNDHFMRVRLLALFYAGILGCVVLFATTASLLVIIGTWLLINSLHTLAQPIIQTWLNQAIQSDTRATILSIQSQITMIGTLTLSSGLSVIGDHFGVAVGIIAANVLLVPLIWLYRQSQQVNLGEET